MASIDLRNTRIALAAGMVAAQTDCTLDQAVIRMQAHARAMNETLEAVALAVAESRLRFAP
jgi:hypothetical protein